MEVLMQIKKILVIQTAFLGDAILTLPMIQKLKQNNPSALIDVISIPNTAELFEASECVNEVIILDKRGKHKSLFQLYKFIKDIKQKKYDEIYSPHRSFRSSLIVMLSGVRETYGFNNSSIFHVYRNIIEYNINDHEVKRNLSLVGFDSEMDWKILPQINVKEEIRTKIKNLINEKDLNPSFVAIAPGSVWSTKRYPLEHYEKIIQELISKKIKVVLIGGSDDRSLCDQLKETDKNIISFAGELKIIESVELLRSASLLITNDSAPTHMGMAADVPVLTLYCSTIPQFGFYPYNNNSKYLSFDELDCKPCGIHGYEVCPLKHFNCGNMLKHDFILSTVYKMLNRS